MYVNTLYHKALRHILRNIKVDKKSNFVFTENKGYAIIYIS